MAIKHGVKTVTTAGTDVALATSVSARWMARNSLPPL